MHEVADIRDKQQSARVLVQAAHTRHHRIAVRPVGGQQLINVRPLILAVRTGIAHRLVQHGQQSLGGFERQVIDRDER